MRLQSAWFGLWQGEPAMAQAAQQGVPEDTPGLAHFMERLARLTNGRVFQTAGEGLGEFVIRDYVSRRAG